MCLSENVVTEYPRSLFVTKLGEVENILPPPKKASLIWNSLEPELENIALVDYYHANNLGGSPENCSL